MQKNVEDATMMEVDSEFMLEDVLLEFVKAQLEDEQKKVELEKTEGQSTIEHEVELMSLDVAEKQVELQYGIVDDNMTLLRGKHWKRQCFSSPFKHLLKKKNNV